MRVKIIVFLLIVIVIIVPHHRLSGEQPSGKGLQLCSTDCSGEVETLIICRLTEDLLCHLLSLKGWKDSSLGFYPSKQNQNLTRGRALRQCQMASLGVESLEKLGSGFLYQGRGRSGKRASNATTAWLYFQFRDAICCLCFEEGHLAQKMSHFYSNFMALLGPPLTSVICRLISYHYIF